MKNREEHVTQFGNKQQIGIVSCWFRSSPGSSFYAVDDEAFHTSEEAQVLGGKRRAYKANEEHRHQQILSTN